MKVDLRLLSIRPLLQCVLATLHCFTNVRTSDLLALQEKNVYKACTWLGLPDIRNSTLKYQGVKWYSKWRETILILCCRLTFCDHFACSPRHVTASHYLTVIQYKRYGPALKKTAEVKGNSYYKYLCTKRLPSMTKFYT